MTTLTNKDIAKFARFCDTLQGNPNAITLITLLQNTKGTSVTLAGHTFIHEDDIVSVLGQHLRDNPSLLTKLSDSNIAPYVSVGLSKLMTLSTSEKQQHLDQIAEKLKDPNYADRFADSVFWHRPANGLIGQYTGKDVDVYIGSERYFVFNH